MMRNIFQGSSQPAEDPYSDDPKSQQKVQQNVFDDELSCQLLRSTTALYLNSYTHLHMQITRHYLIMKAIRKYAFRE